MKVILNFNSDHIWGYTPAHKALRNRIYIAGKDFTMQTLHQGSIWYNFKADLVFSYNPSTFLATDFLPGDNLSQLEMIVYGIE